MGKVSKFLAIAFVLSLITIGCAKVPTELVDATAKSVDVMNTLEPAEYATPDEIGNILNGLAAARAELSVQQDKFFFNRDFDKCKVMIATVKGNTDNLVTELPKRKEAAKLLAQDWSVRADAAINKAGAIILIAPKGKGSRADIEAYTEDLEALRIENAETAKLFNTGKYKAAAARFELVATKATFIYDEIDKVLKKKK